jgi:hypothetical protein
MSHFPDQANQPITIAPTHSAIARVESHPRDIEYMVSPAWSIKVEYLHFDFGRTTIATGSIDTVRFEPGADTVKFGLNYRFGGGYRYL